MCYTTLLYMSLRGTLIFIHGVSGSGKSTIGKYIQQKINEYNGLDTPNICAHLDQDTYYRDKKPFVTFYADDSGKKFTAGNWDCEEAIDYESFTNDILDNLGLYKYVIVSGFALRKDLMRMEADVSFLLKIDLQTEEAKKFISNTRSKSKKFNSIEKREKDYWMVTKIVWPFYMETVDKIQPSTCIVVYDGKGRVDISTVGDTILEVVLKK